MKRDLDLQRRLLLKIEETDAHYQIDLYSDDESPEAVSYNADLLEEAGLILGNRVGGPGNLVYYIPRRLTHDGHEYLDTIRDDNIWSKTKEGAHAVGGAGISILAAIAKGLVKKQIKKHTDVDIEF